MSEARGTEPGQGINTDLLMATSLGVSVSVFLELACLQGFSSYSTLLSAIKRCLELKYSLQKWKIKEIDWKGD